MKLTELVAKLDGCRLLETAPAQVDIESVDIDSRECRKGSLFACVKGYVLDGHDFAGKALERGAAALLTESPALLKEKAAAWEKGYVQGDSILWVIISRNIVITSVFTNCVVICCSWYFSTTNRTIITAS